MLVSTMSCKPSASAHGTWVFGTYTHHGHVNSCIAIAQVQPAHLLTNKPICLAIKCTMDLRASLAMQQWLKSSRVV